MGRLHDQRCHLVPFQNAKAPVFDEKSSTNLAFPTFESEKLDDNAPGNHTHTHMLYICLCVCVQVVPLHTFTLLPFDRPFQSPQGPTPSKWRQWGAAPV